METKCCGKCYHDIENGVVFTLYHCEDCPCHAPNPMKDSIHPEKPLGNTLLRNPDTFERYMHKEETKGCMICEAPFLRDWGLWKIIRNDYPYDAVAQLHYMLVPKRHVAYWYDLSDMEKATLEMIKEDLNQEGAFDSMLENFAKAKTLPGHYHLHLMKWIRV